MGTATEIDPFLANPSKYFGYSLTRMMGLPQEEIHQLQLEGLKRRFSQLRGNLPMLDKLADSQAIHQINDLDDIVPLLFEDAIYKSYPASLLEQHRYKQLTGWLNKLTTLDLSSVDVSACRSVDDWLTTLAHDMSMAIVHTSGTSGTMSFIPWTKTDYRIDMEQIAVLSFQSFGKESPAPQFPLNIDCIYPYFRRGNLSHNVLNDAVVEVIAGGEERFHCAFPGRLSSDMLLLASRIRVAAAKGKLDQIQISPELQARRKEFEAQQNEMPERMTEFFETMLRQLAGKRVFMIGTAALLYPLSVKGLEQGMRNIFASDTVIVAGGGNKGGALPDDWEDVVTEFFGAEKILYSYGMSEMSGTFFKCDNGHYHTLPWTIPFVLDPDTGKPTARTGTVFGRFAFFDLLPDTRWGGFVTGDAVTLTWDKPCSCGRTTAYVEGEIRRYSTIRDVEGEEKLNCAAAPEAYAQAIDFLNDNTLAHNL
jgi:phenylacetate-coenzyme A ligase PaaK-like adenylate-forming protein